MILIITTLNPNVCTEILLMRMTVFHVVTEINDMWILF